MLKCLLLILGLVVSGFGQSYCSLIGDGIFGEDANLTFLGLISNNPYLSTSITNNFGNYGSSYSSTSIFNQYGNFGGQYSSYSAYNPYTTTPPVIVSPNNVGVAFLSKNKFLSGAVVDPDVLMSVLTSNSCSVDIESPVKKIKPFNKMDKRVFDLLGREINGSVKYSLKFK